MTKSKLLLWLKGALYAALAAGVTYLAHALAGCDCGTWGPALGAILAAGAHTIEAHLKEGKTP